MLKKNKIYNITFLQIHNFNSKSFLKTTDWTQITINSSSNMHKPENFVGFFNTNITKLDPNALIVTFNRPTFNKTVTPDHENFHNCSCGSMVSKD